MTAGPACAQAALLAHTMLHHPRAWPKQETALGLLVTLRKFLQTEWVRRRPAMCQAPDMLLMPLYYLVQG
jgi:hypothetical protein